MRNRIYLGLAAIVLMMAFSVSTTSYVSANEGKSAAAGGNVCISVNGHDAGNPNGTADCSSVDGGTETNRAMAFGDGASAIAGFYDTDSGNTAIATGDGAIAVAAGGDNNTATATGDGAIAGAGGGDNNTATATGDDALAEAGFGDNNTATATGDCDAFAFGGDATDSCTAP
jgi:hypothetical protein